MSKSYRQILLYRYRTEKNFIPNRYAMMCTSAMKTVCLDLIVQYKYTKNKKTKKKRNLRK